MATYTTITSRILKKLHEIHFYYFCVMFFVCICSNIYSQLFHYYHLLSLAIMTDWTPKNDHYRQALYSTFCFIIYFDLASELTAPMSTMKSRPPPREIHRKGGLQGRSRANTRGRWWKL